MDLTRLKRGFTNYLYINKIVFTFGASIYQVVDFGIIYLPESLRH